MIKIKVTWPLFFALLLVLVVWLLRADRPPVQPAPQRRAPIAPSRPPRRRTPPAGDNGFVIDQQPRDEYATETERLDREAADRARQVYDDTTRPYEDIKERMNARNDQRQSRANARR